MWLVDFQLPTSTMELDTGRTAQVGILRGTTTLLLASAPFQFLRQSQANRIQ